MHYLLVNYDTGEAVEVESPQPESAVRPPSKPETFQINRGDDVMVYKLMEDQEGRPVKHHIDVLLTEDKFHNEIILPEGWSELSRDDRSSTIAFFLTGFIHEDGKEVLVWQGVKEEGEWYVECHLHDEAPENATHVIEVLVPDDESDTKGMSGPKSKKLIGEFFASGPSEAVETALHRIR